MSTAAPTDVPEKKTPKKQSKLFANAQRLGRSLLLPIAVMPAAGILLRLGQSDMLGAIPGFEQGATIIAAAGNGVFTWLPLLFAVGIAIGWAKKSDGTTALAAVVGYMVMYQVFAAMSPIVLAGVEDANGNQATINFGVLGGIVMGLVSAVLWQRFHRTKMPDFLGFFSGRRLVPILTAAAALVIAVVMSFFYRYFDIALTWAGQTVADNAVLGGGVFGFVNRMLIPVGLHQLLNFFPWFQLGSFTGADGTIVHGDIPRFLAGDPTAGIFQTGFFPIMMFALPAGALAIWRNAKPQNRKLVGGIMLSAALTSFVTGITEPLEYSFMFVAFPLYVIHAVLTGTSLALVNALGINDGFSFSAGAIDYVLNFGKADGAIWLIPIGLAYAVVYYFLFSFVIKKWNLRTPGREEDTIAENSIDAATKP
ncbi:PTS N-acetylglucosamine transporter subunit IIBC [Curtobacterium sp. MCJR17_055]|uniref:PTS transporter subunit EIIC n=1 Tax=unclassified Curtobacterium TaxID=257496 RepID=UPI000D9DDC0F|nr:MULTISPECIES: PTS transporter subunit EIIC [unclassified Curtobacterium]PYY32565.1 PTS N-acetylglucosamine transporter subunit IIBC [Curtobacterium sp. MCBD17_029]PYY48205.1 PTS N-acetylglucosamine transporter subunit IIBC [Curtobacterium sp. MCBD17_023]PYY58801.1 PTS N-acetylglucosamine transporter subunit IIBC [Curtobacterium sp. MCJR17_055]PYY59658.1 PTS N-acetylglucosamine transporter subunit IIBC [Curtobacterium sp. MCPF17_015]PZE91761.1 PTS N-acetylglucosamine transporter subunit IIBC